MSLKKTKPNSSDVEANRQRTAADSRRAEAESERDNAQAVSDFLTRDILAKASPNETLDKAVRDTLVKTLIEPASIIVGERFKGKPLIEASVRSSLTDILLDLGRNDLALAHAEKALSQRRDVLGGDHRDTITSLHKYALVLLRLGRVREAEPLFKQAFEHRSKVLGENHPDTISSLQWYAEAVDSLGRPVEAERLYEQALEKYRKMPGQDEATPNVSLNARLLFSLGRRHEAEGRFKRALDQNRKLLGDEHPETLRSLRQYAVVLSSLGRAREAIPLFQEALGKHRKVLGDDHPLTVVALQALANAYCEAGRREDAAKLMEQFAQDGWFAGALQFAKTQPDMLDQIISIAIRRSEQARNPIDALILGELHLVAGQSASAEKAIRAAIQSGGVAHYYQKSLGWCLLAQGKDDEARKAFHKALKALLRKDGTYDLKNADADHLTAAYFLNMISEQEYVNRVAADNKLGSFAWFYVGQRREIEGDTKSAIEAYERCVDRGAAASAETVYLLARWRLRRLSGPNGHSE